MIARRVLSAAVLLGMVAGPALSQTVQRGQATSPGQSRAMNRLPQPPSGGIPTGSPTAGPMTDQQRDADDRARKATTICKGC